VELPKPDEITRVKSHRDSDGLIHAQALVDACIQRCSKQQRRETQTENNVARSTKPRLLVFIADDTRRFQRPGAQIGIFRVMAWAAPEL